MRELHKDKDGAAKKLWPRVDIWMLKVQVYFLWSVGCICIMYSEGFLVWELGLHIRYYI